MFDRNEYVKAKDYNAWCQRVDAIDAAKDVVDEDEDGTEPTMWDYELSDLTIGDAEGMDLTIGSCCNNHDHLFRTAQEWADRLGKPVYITSDDDALNEEVEPSEAAEDAEDAEDELEDMTPAAR